MHFYLNTFLDYSELESIYVANNRFFVLCSELLLVSSEMLEHEDIVLSGLPLDVIVMISASNTVIVCQD